MAFGKDNTDWISKEKRELLCKAVNSILMTNPERDVDEALKEGKTIVDFAFTNYPDTPIVPEGDKVSPTQFKTRDDFQLK